MTPLAHVGHWYHSLLYAVPIVLIALALWWSGRRDDRRRDAARGAVPPQAPGGSGAGEDPEAGGRA
ncbi:MAG: hypothetical protein KGR19_01330 [Acidobacteria bacterium]|nr:hypothetical protein [Acidobacteriota bacterium]